MFSSGMDFGGLAALAADPGRLREFRRPILEAWNLLEEMAKPTISQVHGACIGGAMELALACDLRVMAADALIGMPETRVGLIPDVGGSSRLPAVVGLGRAKELVMTGRMIDGTEAERIGLVNRVAPADELDATTAALVGELLACAPVAVGHVKRVLDGAAKPALAATLEHEVTVQAAVRAHRGLHRGHARVRREAPARVQRALAATRTAPRRRGPRRGAHGARRPAASSSARRCLLCRRSSAARSGGRRSYMSRMACMALHEVIGHLAAM